MQLLVINIHQPTLASLSTIPVISLTIHSINHHWIYPRTGKLKPCPPPDMVECLEHWISRAAWVEDVSWTGCPPASTHGSHSKKKSAMEDHQFSRWEWQAIMDVPGIGWCGNPSRKLKLEEWGTRPALFWPEMSTLGAVKWFFFHWWVKYINFATVL